MKALPFWIARLAYVMIWSLFGAVFRQRRGSPKAREHAEWLTSKAWWSIKMEKKWKSGVWFARGSILADPGYSNGYYALAVAYGEGGWTDKAREACEQGLVIDPAHPELLGYLAGLHMQEEHFAEAEAGYRRALGMQPDRPEWVFNLWLALEKQDRRNEADAVAEANRHLASKFADLSMVVADVHIRRGDLQGARDYLEGAVRTEPGLVMARRNLAVVLTQLGNWEEAGREAYTATELDPSDDAARRLLTSIESRLNVERPEA